MRVRQRSRARSSVLRLLTRDALTGTAYVEFQPGAYCGEHWKETSVYLEEEAYQLVEGPLAGALVHYNAFGPNCIWKRDWDRVRARLVEGRTAAEREDLEPLLCWFERAYEAEDCVSVLAL